MAALKIQFGFRGGALHLTGVDSSGHPAPPSDPILPPAMGFWLSVHDKAGVQVHAQILNDPRTGGGTAPERPVRDRDYIAFTPDPGADGFIVFHLAFQPSTSGPSVALFPLKRSWGFNDLLQKLLKPFKPRKQRAWLLVLSDGFAQDEAAKFDAFADAFVDALCAAPPFADFSALRGAIVKRAGPATAGGGLHWKITELADRPLIEVDPSVTTRFVWGLDVDPVNVLVVVNLDRYGGSGGDPAVTAVGAPGQQLNAIRAAIHELGHSAFALADEYAIAGSGASSSPIELNVAQDEPSVRAKWGELLTPGIALPTAAEPQPGGPPVETLVGMFQGAKWDPVGNYRSQLNCRMRSVEFDFCAACQSVIRSVLQSEL